jgi:hypothetical protein
MTPGTKTGVCVLGALGLAALLIHLTESETAKTAAQLIEDAKKDLEPLKTPVFKA